MDNSLYLVIETQKIDDGRELKALRPDEYGYYDLPMMVLNSATYSDVIYDAKSMIDIIRDTTSRFNILLTDGKLYGERGHPYGSEDDVKRACSLVEKEFSHHFRSVYTVPFGGDKVLIRAKIKPCEPWGRALEESLANPFENTSFSVRAICNQVADPSGKLRRYAKYLTTFDSVFGGGFKEACKRYAYDGVAMENFSYTKKLNIEDFYKPSTVVSTESFTDADILKLFDATKVVISSRRTVIRLPNSETVIDEKGNKRSLIHSIFK